MQKMQLLLPLSDHAHLAEPGSLCALGACASKLLENGLGTRRRTSYLLTASGVGTRSPTWTTAVEREGAVICTHSQLGGVVGVVGGRERRVVNVHLAVVGLELMIYICAYMCAYLHMHSALTTDFTVVYFHYVCWGTKP